MTGDISSAHQKGRGPRRLEKRTRRLWAVIVATLFSLISLVPVAHATPGANLALGKPAVADSTEVARLGADKAFDGSTSDTASRWSSKADAQPGKDGGPHWVYVDLGDTHEVSAVRLYWELRKAKGYKIQVASGDGAPAPDSADWRTVYANPDRPAALTDLIQLSQPELARFVRLYIDANTYADPDGGAAWGSVSIFEMEVYEGKPAQSMEELARAIQVKAPAAGDTTLAVTLPESEEFDVVYNGTDYEQVVDAERHIYPPLVDTDVLVSFKVSRKDDPKQYMFREIPVTIPAAIPAGAGNPAPAVVPELRQWKGGTGSFSPTGRVLFADPGLERAARELAADYTDLFGKEMTVVAGSDVKAGDILLTLSGDKALGAEGYDMSVTDKIVVDAAHPTGGYWATRTILQALKSGGQTIPQGEARDYPLYKVRGFMLDVGRKAFSMDYLKQMVKQLSWYKINDFQIHLNDNYIWVEEYTNDTVDQAYSGFRLESDIKAGGNNGLNKADLTSTDMSYSKDEFRSFIKDARALGINIVPEFDMPAHSLAFTKVRPDLRTPTELTHRGNDHLNLATKYDESFAFARSVWDEYLTGEDPVFDSKTTVHIGADEFEADGNAYRTFVNDIFSHVEKTGHTGRVWGSLKRIQGTVKVSGIAADGTRREANLWSADWADMRDMYDYGFGLINTNDSPYYIVPNATYYGDYLNLNTIYNHPITDFGRGHVPAGDPQMYGGAFAVWNDMIGKRANGMSEYDIYDRVNHALGVYASTLWGKGVKNAEQIKEVSQRLGDAPRTNFGYRAPVNEQGVVAHYTWEDGVDKSGNAGEVTLSGGAKLASIDGKSVLSLPEPTSYASTGLGTVGLGNDLRVKVKRMSDVEDQVLFESAYGQIKAVQKGTGKVGISRENYDYSFNYTLPRGRWVELEFKNEQNYTELRVNGELIEKIGLPGRGKLKATTMFPVERIGADQNGFVGFVDDVRIGTDGKFNSTMELDAALTQAHWVLAQKDDGALAALVKEAQPILDSFDPAAEAISQATKKITDYLAGAEFDKADYSRVKALIAATPSDLTRYTDASVEAIGKAIDDVEYDLPAGQQDIVDSWEAALAATRAGRVEKGADETIIEGLTATASSEERTGEHAPASNAVDGNISTIWHSKWSQPAAQPPHWIELVLPTSSDVQAEPAAVAQRTAANKSYEITALTYVPRQDGTNGILEAYRVEAIDETGQANEIVSGRVENVRQELTIAFPEPVKDAARIRLVFTESRGGFASAGELKLHYKPSLATAEDLSALVKEADQLSDAAYDPQTWKPFEAARAAAQAVDEGAGVEDIDLAAANLRTAMLNLTVSKTEIHTVEFKDLGTSVSVVAGQPVAEPTETPTKDGYTFDYWADASGTRYDFTTPVTADLVLTPVFVKNEQPGPVDPAGPGTGEPSAPADPTEKPSQLGATAPDTKVPEKSGEGALPLSGASVTTLLLLGGGLTVAGVILVRRKESK